MTDTQANERHLTPKPLHEQVPGGWNFIDPMPVTSGVRLTKVDAGTIQAATLSAPRIQISQEARERLMGTSIFRAVETDFALDDDGWTELEEALGEILFPSFPRYVLGVQPPIDDDRCITCHERPRYIGLTQCSRCRG